MWGALPEVRHCQRRARSQKLCERANRTPSASRNGKFGFMLHGTHNTHNTAYKMRTHFELPSLTTRKMETELSQGEHLPSLSVYIFSMTFSHIIGSDKSAKKKAHELNEQYHTQLQDNPVSLVQPVTSGRSLIIKPMLC